MSLKFLVKYLYDIMLVVLLLLVFNYYMSYKGIMIVDRKYPVTELTTYTFGENDILIEGMSNKRKKEFCQVKHHKHNLQELDNSCRNLDGKVCKNIDCCIYARDKNNNNMNCLAGGKDGAIYNKDNYDLYYHNNNCYGKCKQTNK